MYNQISFDCKITRAKYGEHGSTSRRSFALFGKSGETLYTGRSSSQSHGGPDNHR